MGIAHTTRRERGWSRRPIRLELGRQLSTPAACARARSPRGDSRPSRGMPAVTDAKRVDPPPRPGRRSPLLVHPGASILDDAWILESAGSRSVLMRPRTWSARCAAFTTRGRAARRAGEWRRPCPRARPRRGPCHPRRRGAAREARTSRCARDSVKAPFLLGRGGGGATMARAGDASRGRGGAEKRAYVRGALDDAGARERRHPRARHP
jgi:hypothetical protein